MTPASVATRPTTFKQWVMADIRDVHRAAHLVGVIGDDAEMDTFRTVKVRTKDEVDAAAREWGEVPGWEDRHWYRVRKSNGPGLVLIVEFCALAEVPPADVDMLGAVCGMTVVSRTVATGVAA